jgi:NAD+ kinase
MAFHLGSLGFLTPFQFQNFQDQVTNVLEGHAALTLRSRLSCMIVRKSFKEQQKGSDSDRNDISSDCDGSGNDSISSNTLPSTNILVLNEVIMMTRRPTRSKYIKLKYFFLFY